MRTRSSSRTAPAAKRRPQNTALGTGLRLLSGRAHSRVETQRKLAQRGYPPDEVEAALARLDELGYLPTEPSFGPALYELIAGRYTKRPTVITSNKSLTDWSLVVQDVSLAAAIVDRIVHHGQVFYLKGPSWRAKDRPELGGPSEAAG